MSEKTPSSDKKARLAEALRENLKRRKAQTRARNESAAMAQEPAAPLPSGLAAGDQEPRPAAGPDSTKRQG